MDMRIESMKDGVTKATLNGRLDILGAQKIDLGFAAAVGTHRRFIVDLAGVSFLASMGIRTLIMGAKTVKSKGGRMALLSPSPDVERVLVESGTDTIVPIFHDLDAAVSAVCG